MSYDLSPMLAAFTKVLTTDVVPAAYLKITNGGITSHCHWCSKM